MRYAEVIYEGGAHSVVQFDDESELQGALAEQHRRALAGEDGGPAGHNAERVHSVIIYDEDPGNYGQDRLVPAGTVSSLVSAMAGDNGNVDVYQLIAALRDEVSSVYPVNQGKHASQFKAEGVQYPLDFLNDTDGGVA